MEKKTKTLLLAGMGALVLDGAGWRLLGRRQCRVDFFDPARSRARLREQIGMGPRALLQTGSGRMAGVRPLFSGQA